MGEVTVAPGAETASVALLHGEMGGITHGGREGDCVRAFVAHAQGLLWEHTRGLEDASCGVERGRGSAEKAVTKARVKAPVARWADGYVHGLGLAG
ncbi:hypothetical protein JCM16408A_47270 [Methylobacterium phyllosphaerae]